MGKGRRKRGAYVCMRTVEHSTTREKATLLLVTTCVNAEDVTLSETSQTQEHKIIRNLTHVWNLKYSNSEAKSAKAFARGWAWRWRKGEMEVKRGKVSLNEGWRNVVWRPKVQGHGCSWQYCVMHLKSAKRADCEHPHPAPHTHTPERKKENGNRVRRWMC